MGKEYKVYEGKWAEPGCDVKLAGRKLPGAQASEFTPDSKDRLGEVCAWRGKGKKPANDYVLVEKKHFIITPAVMKGRFFKKKAGWIKAVGEDGEPAGYVQVLRVRAAAVAACVLAAIAALIIAYSLSVGVAPQDAPAYFADATGITHNNADVKATIEYATYESTPDQTWAADQTHQDMVLRLPAEVTTTDSDGNETTNDNPVIAAPHVYVDLNGDGEFSDDELVFNPIERDSDGNVTDWGQFLEPGQQIDGIDLVQTVPAGSYSAETLWTPLSKSDNSEANPMTFKWNLTVE